MREVDPNVTIFRCNFLVEAAERHSKSEDGCSARQQVPVLLKCPRARC